MAAAGTKLRLFDTIAKPNNQQKISGSSSKSFNSAHNSGATSSPPDPGLAFCCGSGHGLAVEEWKLLLAAEADALAGALCSHVTPWAARSPSCLLRASVEAPCWGAPGLTAYLGARRTWIDSQVASALAEGTTQVVLLGSGIWDTRSFRLLAPGVTFYEVAPREAIARKRELVQAAFERNAALQAALPGALAPGGAALPGVRYAGLSSWAALVEAITAKGFDPDRPAVFVAEGLLYYLEEAAAASLLSDVAALAAPGSLLLLDLLHSDALEGRAAPPGFINLARRLQDKGSPLKSATPPQFSGLVRLLAPHHFRPLHFLPPPEIHRQVLGSAAAGEWHPDRPTLPLFFSLAAAVKAGPPLLLRHAPLDGGAEAPWADLAVSNSSCWLGGMLWMLFGWRAGRQAAGGKHAEEGSQQQGPLPPTLPGAVPPTGGLVGQAGTPGTSQPASPLAGADALARPAGDAGSGEWKLGAAAAPSGPLTEPQTLAAAAATLERLAAEAAGPALAAGLAPAAGSSAESVEAVGGGQATLAQPHEGVLETAFWWENM